jgi:S1-C subfamily serine protease
MQPMPYDEQPMTDPLGPFYGPPPPPPPRRHGARSLPLVIVAVLAAGVGAGSVIGLRGSSGPSVASPDTTTPSASAPSSAGSTPSGGSRAPSAAPGSVPGAAGIPVPPAGTPAGASGALNAQAVADKVQPGMVNISAPEAYGQNLSEGTGIILTSTGLVVTNNHVIEGATSPTATLVSSGKTYKATIVGYNKAADVALLQLTGASGLTPVTVGNSDGVKVGMHVLGLGNAQGQGGQPTVAPGLVTALNQSISPQDSSTQTSENLHGTIQTSAQIQPGDSGGPLANAAGQVIGMDVAASQVQQFNGTQTTAGYAIPINQALQIARQIATGQASTDVQIGLPPFMGVSIADASKGCPSSSSGGLGGSSGGVASSGALVCGVYSGTPAETAGLAQGDVITNADGKAVGTANSLIAITAGLHPGQAVSLRYTDGTGASRSLTLTLIGGPAK